MAGRLQGRTVVITGASSGIGAHLAHAVVGAGGRVVLGARRVDRLEALARELAAKGGEALAVSYDATDPAAAAALISAGQARFGAVDTLINNAGIALDTRAVDLPVEAFDQTMAVNVRGPFLLSQAFVRALLAGPDAARARGRIVNIASIAGLAPLTGMNAYSISKAALIMQTRALAKEWARFGIGVNAICPGFIPTEINAGWLDSARGQESLARFPRRRVIGIEGLMEPTLYFASDAAAFTTGAVLAIDDGQSLSGL
jgi:NAD(P)-dependent dehydrogenase (short-subunit alcohol dehydrogenase family)